MKTLKGIESHLTKNKPFLRKRFNVERIGLFGSNARGKATPRSDIDILVGFSRPIGWEFVDLKEYLEKLLGCRVDLVTVNALKPQMMESVMSEVIYAGKGLRHSI
jgi:predicted nucleotidyltransferase